MSTSRESLNPFFPAKQTSKRISHGVKIIFDRSQVEAHFVSVHVEVNWKLQFIKAIKMRPPGIQRFRTIHQLMWKFHLADSLWIRKAIYEQTCATLRNCRRFAHKVSWLIRWKTLRKTFWRVAKEREIYRRHLFAHLHDICIKKLIFWFMVL